MSVPFLSEIKLFSFQFAPEGWAHCNGQLLPINQNQALFALIGTTYGGDGRTTFALPDLRGRVPIHLGIGFTQGQAGGQEYVTVNLSQLPAHNHAWVGTTLDGGTDTPTNALLATSADVYAEPADLTTLHASTVSNVGGSQPHNNLQPYLTLNYCIALIGAFPTRNN